MRVLSIESRFHESKRAEKEFFMVAYISTCVSQYVREIPKKQAVAAGLASFAVSYSMQVLLMQADPVNALIVGALAATAAGIYSLMVPLFKSLASDPAQDINGQEKMGGALLSCTAVTLLAAKAGWRALPSQTMAIWQIIALSAGVGSQYRSSGSLTFWLV